MVKMINKLTGTMMLVADDRLEEYLTEGHTKLEDKASEEADSETGSAAEAVETKAESKKKGSAKK